MPRTAITGYIQQTAVQANISYTMNRETASMCNPLEYITVKSEQKYCPCVGLLQFMRSDYNWFGYIVHPTQDIPEEELAQRFAIAEIRDL